jgi:hypothetical protein
MQYLYRKDIFPERVISVRQQIICEEKCVEDLNVIKNMFCEARMCCRRSAENDRLNLNCDQYDFQMNGENLKVEPVEIIRNP